jgi:hypothetical protein
MAGEITPYQDNKWISLGLIVAFACVILILILHGFFEMLVAIALGIGVMIVQGFFRKVGGTLFSGFLQSFPSSKNGNQFTGSSFEDKLGKEIDDLNPNRETDIRLIDYDYKMGGSIIIEYISKSREPLGVRSEVENIAYAFSSVYSDMNHPCGELNVNILNESGITYAYYRIDSNWAESYHHGEINDIEYVGKVMNTYEKNE